MISIHKFKEFNESLWIDNEDSFISMFGIDKEKIEDYLTEISDEYDITIEWTKHDNGLFYILVYMKDEFFDYHLIVDRMNSFIKRMKIDYNHINYIGNNIIGVKKNIISFSFSLSKANESIKYRG